MKKPTFTFDESAPEVSFSVHQKEDASDRDWFNLSILVMVGGENVPFQELFTALSADQAYLLLPSGRYFSLRHKSFAELHRTIREARSLENVSSDGIAISRFQIDFWNKLQKRRHPRIV